MRLKASRTSSQKLREHTQHLLMGGMGCVTQQQYSLEALASQTSLSLTLKTTAAKTSTNTLVRFVTHRMPAP